MIPESHIDKIDDIMMPEWMISADKSSQQNKNAISISTLQINDKMTNASPFLFRIMWKEIRCYWSSQDIDKIARTKFWSEHFQSS